MHNSNHSDTLKEKHFYTLTIDNNIYEIENVVSKITSQFINLISEKEIFNISLGLSELITNAVEHGNLELSYDEKTKFLQDGTYYEEIARRADIDPYKDRRVVITYCIDRDKLKFVIKDDGRGFDWRNLPSPESILSECHGRGITIIRHYFDEICFNEIGNEVTLLKKIRYEKNRNN